MGGPNRSLGTEPTQSSESLLSTGGNDRDLGQLEPGTMVGEYRIDGLLGEGGMGRVYSATHPVIGKLAAVKVLHPALSAERTAVDRFIQEARAVNQIGHPNIIDIFAFGSLPDGRCYFVMEQLRGESLACRIERSSLPMLDVLEILDTIAVALEAAHRKGIIHRDLKPDNVFLEEIEGKKPQVKLLDFGIAKLVGGGGEARLERTRTGNVMGTPAYLSPEQARGQGVDHRTDIYAFGAVAYELLTRELPFPATNAADMIAKHLFAEPPSAHALNPAVDPEFDDLIKRLLAKDANERPTLEEAREQLRACRDRILQGFALHEGGHTDPVIHVTGTQTAVGIKTSSTTLPPEVQAASRRIVYYAAGAIVAVAVVAVAIALSLGGDDERATERATEAPSANAPATTPSSEPPATPAPPSAPPVATPPTGGTPSANASATTPTTADSTTQTTEATETTETTETTPGGGTTPATTKPAATKKAATSTKPARKKPPVKKSSTSTTTPTKPPPIEDPDAPM